MPALDVRLSQEAAKRVDRLIEVMERLATATEKVAEQAEAKGMKK